MIKYPISQIVGTGHAVPDNVVSNHDLEKMVETSDEWIVARTGIKERRVAPEGLLNSDLCSDAAREALEEAGVKAEDIDAIVLGTVSGDVNFPATACYVQEKIGAVNAVAFDISAACSGFLYGLNVANGLIAGGQYKNILVIGSDTLSRITDWTDRNTCVLFGDGAGAAVLQASQNGKGILAEYMKSDGRLSHLLMNPGHYTGKDYINSDGKKIKPFIHMAGRETFKHAVRSMSDAIKKVLEKADVSVDDIDYLIPHQANIRIIDMIGDMMKIPREKTYINIDKYGNTSAATLPIALNELRKSGAVKDGSLCLMVVFGGGFTWGAILVRF